MSFTYPSGEEIRKGDRITFHGDQSEVEFVADPHVSDPETDWYIKEFGGGIGIVEIESKSFGRIFLTEPENQEDLVFMSRRRQGSTQSD